MASSSSSSVAALAASSSGGDVAAMGKPHTVSLTLASEIVDIPAFEALRLQMAEDDGVRESVIKRSRDVLKLAKTAIYCLHRKQMDLAESNLSEAQAITTAELFPLVESRPQLRWGGALSSALEEYAEARIFQTYLVSGKVAGPASPGLGGIVGRDEFLGGVMDFIGELTRVTVLAATARDEEAVARGRGIVEDVQMVLMGFDFRNGQLRRKYDAIKYSLKKIEQITYELSLTKALGGFAMESRTMASGGVGEDGEDEDGGDDSADGKPAKRGSGRGRGGKNTTRDARGGMGRGRKGAAVQASIAGASSSATTSDAKRPKPSSESSAE